LDAEGRARKIYESETFYIPMARALRIPQAEKAADRIEENLRKYRKRRAEEARAKGRIAVMQNYVMTRREELSARFAQLNFSNKFDGMAA